MKTNKKDLASGKNYLGTWLNEGKVYLDVSENIMDRAEAIRLGQERNQLAIYDVVAGDSIDTGGTGSVGKRSQYSSNQRYIRNDRQRGRRLRSRTLGKNDSGEVDKHLAGKHDQATHGRKKFNYFTAGSLFKDQDSLQSSIEGLTDPNKTQFANGNVGIKVLLERQGKGGQPDVFDSIEELREVNPDAEIIYRGTDEAYRDTMFYDDYDRTGTGAFGDGYYFSSSQGEANNYARDGLTVANANPTVIQGAMKANARVKVFSNTEELDDYGRDAMNKAVRDIEATGLDSRTLSPDGRSTISISDFTTASFYNTFTTAASTQLILEGFDAMQLVSDYPGRNTYTVVFNREAMQVVAD
jgi:hypothetical protein